MSKYTMELRKVIDYYTIETVKSWFTNYELSDYLTQEQINVINEAGVWNKEKLAQKIINHYFVREIGLETPALFEHYAKVKMDEIMEEKLPLIYSNSIQYNPLINVDYTETFTRNVEGDTSGSGTSKSVSNGSGLTVNSDTPQGEINKINILSGQFASQTQAGESENTVNDETQTNELRKTKENYSKNVKGNSGVSATNQKMIEQYRQNIIAIDRDIIKELNILFMGLY